ncbi:unnamed protein product [Symbiodinium sp. CCMP2592]|nr:unnamed protein product [Symbiodinium sp. CCMP2592]
MDCLLDYLLKHSLAYKQRIRCEHIGCHELNRDGQGVSAEHCHELLSSLASLGFVPGQCKSVCLECPPDSRGDATRAFNKAVIDRAGGKLAPLSLGPLRYSTILGSHTNQAFRLVVAKLAHANAALTSEGFLNIEKVREVDAALADAITEGIEWVIVGHEIQDEFVKFATLFQAAGNACGQISKPEDEMQVAKKILLSVQGFMQLNGTNQVKYEDVSKEILRSKPPCAPWVCFIFRFVLQAPGGLSPASSSTSFLLESEAHIRTHGRRDRSLGMEWWDAISADAKGQKPRVLFKHAMLKLAYCEANSKAVTASDVRKILSSRDAVVKLDAAEDAFIQFRQILAKEGIDSIQAQEAMAFLEQEVAALVLVKKFRKYEDVDSACHAAMEALSEKIGRVIPHSWPIHELDASGAVVNAARVVSKGFRVGDFVERKADGLQATVKVVGAEKVVLELQDGSQVEGSAQSFLDGHWKQSAPRSDPVRFDSWPSVVGFKSFEMQALLLRARIVHAMEEQFEKLMGAKSVALGLTVYQKPRDVRAHEDLAVRQLQLPVTTTRIEIRSAAEDPSNSIVVGRTTLAGKDVWVILSPVTTWPTATCEGFLNPSWLMRPSAVRKEANCELVGIPAKPADPFELPVIKNFKKISQNESLVLYRPGNKSPAPVEVLQPLSKKAKVA